MKWTDKHKKELGTNKFPDYVTISYVDEVGAQRSFRVSIPYTGHRKNPTDFKTAICDMLRKAYDQGRADIKRDVRKDLIRVRGMLDLTNLW